MMNTYLDMNQLLRAEADHLLSLGLFDILQQHCDVTVVGSYALNLMTWRDLDLYGDATDVDLESIYDIVNGITPIYHPVWFEGKEDRMSDRRCFFVGFETDLLGTGRWNVDIWFFEREILDQQHADLTRLQQEITQDIQQTILRLKTTLCMRGDYGKTIQSIHLYDAVINHHLTTVNQIDAWMSTQIETSSPSVPG